MSNRGILIGRFQPFHVGHQAIISEIIADGLDPLVIIGSRDTINDKNPFSYDLRKEMIRMVFPSIKIIGVADDKSDKEWVYNICKILEYDDCIYYHRKSQDLDSSGNHYVDFFKPNVTVKEVSYHNMFKDQINSTDIRNNFEINKRFLDGRVYNFIKSLKTLT
jgi:cytidyltransferase-like protein